MVYKPKESDTAEQKITGHLRKELIANIIPSSNEFGESKGDGWGKGPKAEAEEKEKGKC